MFTKRVSPFVAVVLAVSIAHIVTSGQMPDRWEGTWKVNLAKSKYNPGPPPKSTTLKIEPAADGGQKHTFDGVDAQGQTTRSERVTKFDGNESAVQAIPSTEGNTTNTLRRINANSYEVTVKVNGTVTTTHRIVVSNDGKAMTETSTRKTAQGQTAEHTIVYERQ